MTLTPDEIRIIGLSAPMLLKLLQRREERILNKIYGEWRAGKTEFTAALAEWASVRDQINEINSVLKAHDNKEETPHANRKRSER